jgi:HK97 family phage prohead protease
MAYAKRRIRMQVRATPDAGEGTFVAKVSTYDLEYDVGWNWTEVIQSACFEESIAKHPTIPVFYNHGWGLAPVGSGKPTETANALTVAGRMYLEIGDPMVARVYQAMLDEALEEWSIGFWPEEITWNSDNPLCDIISKGDLAEASICVRGANPDTGTLELNARRRVWIEGDEAEREREVSRLRSRFNVVDLGRRSSEICSSCGHETRGPTGKGVDEGSWDGAASRFSDDQYKTACAVCRGDDPDHPKQDCSLPHHEPDGKVSRAGVHAAAGRVSGTSLTDEQKATAAAHLRSHYSKDLEEDPPDSIKADAFGAPSSRAGHSHEHAHGDASHSHEHTHSGGNYDHGDNAADPDNEVTHDHSHDGPEGAPSEEDPGLDTDSRDRLYRALGSEHWAPVLADLKGNP